MQDVAKRVPYSLNLKPFRVSILLHDEPKATRQAGYQPPYSLRSLKCLVGGAKVLFPGIDGAPQPKPVEMEAILSASRLCSRAWRHSQSGRITFDGEPR